MYKCCNGHIFDEFKHKTKHITGLNIPDSGYDEECYMCPECKSEDFYKAVECDYCGKIFAQDSEDYLYFRRSGDTICNNCLHDYCMDNFKGDKYYG